VASHTHSMGNVSREGKRAGKEEEQGKIGLTARVLQGVAALRRHRAEDFIRGEFGQCEESTRVDEKKGCRGMGALRSRRWDFCRREVCPITGKVALQLGEKQKAPKKK